MKTSKYYFCSLWIYLLIRLIYSYIPKISLLQGLLKRMAILNLFVQQVRLKFMKYFWSHFYWKTMTFLYRVPQTKLWLRKSSNCSLFQPFICIFTEFFLLQLDTIYKKINMSCQTLIKVHFSWDIQVYIGVVLL